MTRDEIKAEADRLRAKGMDLTDEDVARAEELAAKAAEMDAAEDRGRRAAAALSALAQKRAAADVRGGTPGERFIRSDEWTAFKAAHRAGFESKSDLVDVTVKAATLSTDSATTGGGKAHLGSPVDLGFDVPKGTLLSAITTGPTEANWVPYRAITAVTGKAARVAEAKDSAGTGADGGVKPLVGITAASYSAVPATFADGIEVTNQEITDDGVMMTLVDQVLSLMVSSAIEQEILNGTGAGDAPQGILTATGVRQVPFATDMLTTIRKAMTALGKGTVPANSISILMNPEDVEAVDLLKKNDGGYLGSGPFGSGNPTIWRRPIVESDAIPKGKALVGDLRAYELYVREAFSVSLFNQHKDYAQRNLSYLRGEMRAIPVFRRRAHVAVVSLAGG